MKNTIIAVVSLAFLASCVNKVVEVRLFSPNTSPTSNTPFYREVGRSTKGYEPFKNIKVIDNRKNKNVLGKKRYGHEEVDITNNQNLAHLIKTSLIHDLKEKNYAIDQDKTLKITLKTLSYDSSRGLFLGKSQVEVIVSLALIDNNSNNMEYNKTYNFQNENPHFIISLDETDEENINLALEEIVNRIIEDGGLQHVLIDQNNTYGY